MSRELAEQLDELFVDLNLGQLYSQYVKATGDEDFQTFLSHLWDQDLLDSEQYRHALMRGQILLSPEIQEIETEERFLNLGPIAEGGMGKILVAHDQRLKRKVAVKVLKGHWVEPWMVKCFIREAQITAQLDHPNVVPVHEFEPAGNLEKNHAFVMKLVSGRTLSQIIDQTKEAFEKSEKPDIPADLTLSARLEYLLKVCDAVAYAHSKGLIHRDLKPDNIMVGEFGEVYVMDWGLARLLKTKDETALLEKAACSETDVYVGETQHGSILGTPTYMAPEQAEGKTLSELSDLYSLGLILFALVTLQQAREGTAIPFLLLQAARGQKKPLVHVRPGRRISKDLAAIVDKATAIQPEDRYSTVEMFADDIRRFMQNRQVMARPDNTIRRFQRGISKHLFLTLSIVLGLVLSSAAVTGWSLFRREAESRRAEERENHLIALQAAVAEQSHLIDRQFLRFEESLVGLVEEVDYLVHQAPANDEHLYLLDDFNDPARAPSDLADSSLYQRLVSLDYPVVKLAPGVSFEEVQPLLSKLGPLRHHYRALLLNSRYVREHLSADEENQLLRDNGVPIRWVYIGLEAGVMYSYPGKGTYTADYDPRVRPWYELSAGREGLHWGNPYWDSQGQGVVLPCSTSLFDAEGNFFGVAGLEVTFDDISDLFLVAAAHQHVIAAYLLDEQRRVVVSSDPDYDYGDGESLAMAEDPSLELRRFHVGPAVEAIGLQNTGVIEIEGGYDGLYVFSDIRTLGWTYVEHIDTEIAFGAEQHR